MWSPKRRSDGARNQFYINMTEVSPGDVVFSYSKQHISQIGIVSNPAKTASRPDEFGSVGQYWGDDGWLVTVNWHRVKYPIRPKDHFSLIKPTLPAKFSPLSREKGKGLQAVYLAAVPDNMAEVLLTALRNPPIEKYIKETISIPDASITIDNEKPENKVKASSALYNHQGSVDPTNEASSDDLKSSIVDLRKQLADVDRQNSSMKRGMWIIAMIVVVIVIAMLS